MKRVIDLTVSPATMLKDRLENTEDLIVCSGMYDGFSARIALSVGFDALYLVSSASCFLIMYAELTRRRPEPRLQSRRSAWAIWRGRGNCQGWRRRCALMLRRVGRISWMGCRLFEWNGIEGLTLPWLVLFALLQQLFFFSGSDV